MTKRKEDFRRMGQQGKKSESNYLTSSLDALQISYQLKWWRFLGLHFGCYRVNFNIWTNICQKNKYNCISESARVYRPLINVCKNAVGKILEFLLTSAAKLINTAKVGSGAANEVNLTRMNRKHYQLNFHSANMSVGFIVHLCYRTHIHLSVRHYSVLLTTVPNK